MIPMLRGWYVTGADLLAAKPGDMDRIARHDTGAYDGDWLFDHGDRHHRRYLYGTRGGRDCPACPAPREEHDGWGCPSTGCQLSIALITGRPS